jgi:hypothetical protein
MEINTERIRDLAKIIRKLRYKPIFFDDPNLFPEYDDFIYPNYVFFLVAIDHRTGFKKRITHGSKKYHGSDIIFYLARRVQKQHPKFFTAENLKDVDAETVKKIFKINNEIINNPEQRAFLLRDCAKKLLKFSGNITNLFKDSEYYLMRKGNGILEKLRAFRAYEDPLMKKSYLLIKILKRQGMKIKDPHNLRFPIDGVLVRIALSSGIIVVDDRLRRRFENHLTPQESLELRELTSRALDLLSKYSKIDPDILDDILWCYGREIDEGKINTNLDKRMDKEALEEFLSFLKYKRAGKIKFPDTWYF